MLNVVKGLFERGIMIIYIGCIHLLSAKYLQVSVILMVIILAHIKPTITSIIYGFPAIFIIFIINRMLL